MMARSGRMPWRRLLTAALAAAAIFLYWTHVAERGQREVMRSPAAADASTPVQGQSWGASVGFADQRRLEEHFEKHGAEFGRITKQDYLRQAQLLRDAKVGGPVLQTVRADGVTTRFDRQTGGVGALNPNRTIPPLFKPKHGGRHLPPQTAKGGGR